MANYIETYKSKLDWANTFNRTGDFPLDRSSMFSSYDDAVLYANGGRDSRGLSGVSYVGQIITVYENGKVDVYVINSDKSLKSVGGDASPIGYGESEHSAVLKGGNNQVISEGGVALGKDNLVGLKGFYYKYITLKAGGNTKLANVYLSKTQVSNPTIDTNSGASFKDTSIKPQNYWAVGDIISIVNDAKYDDIATVVQIKDGLIQIEWLDGKSPFSTVKQESDLSSEDYSIYCLDKPTQGISDLGKYSFANGTDNKAINVYTEVSGKGNVAKEKFAKVWGKDNVGGYNTTTFGTGNVNLADNSLVNGTNNINEGNNSVIHGNKNKNYGKRAFVVGNENITKNENEAAFGKYNNSENDTQFSIGIGTSESARKNAFEVKQNGDIYIEGVEGRIQDKLNDISNINKTIEDNEEVVAAALNELSENINNKCDNSRAEELQTLITNMQTYINALETRIVELETVISQITVQKDN